MKTHRLIIVSDLHLGGPQFPMLGHPEHLADFFGQVARRTLTEGEQLELVINGDFVDFLAEPPYQAWAPDERTACDTLERVSVRFEAVFKKLKEAVQRVTKLTILLGNHDLELALPKVRMKLGALLGSHEHQKLHFITNNEAYRVGDVLVEHGNRYDSWNAIDYDGLRRTLSCLSRGEFPSNPMEACPGSRMVESVINILKERYTFIDLLKPETKVVSLLLTAIEPSLSYDLPLLYRAASARFENWSRTRPWLSPFDDPSRRLAAHELDSGLPAEVRTEFADELRDARSAVVPAGGGQKLQHAFRRLLPESLRYAIDHEQAIPEKRLRRIQVSLKHALNGDRTFENDSADGPYVDAARRLAICGSDRPCVIVMGHTHHRREIRLDDNKWYINTGTWVDSIRVPPDFLEKEKLKDFEGWLRNLILQPKSLRIAEPTFAEIVLNGEGRLVHENARPFLRQFSTEALSS